jgi:hypothetical protein
MQSSVLNLQPIIAERVNTSYIRISNCFHKLGYEFHPENAIAIFQITTSLQYIHCVWCLCILTRRIPFTERYGSSSQYLTSVRCIAPLYNFTLPSSGGLTISYVVLNPTTYCN